MNHNLQINFQLQKLPFRLRRRRGVAEIIGTMMLMAITVVGATVLSYFVNTSFDTGNITTSTSSDVTANQIKLLEYDTRDSDSTTTPLLGITNVYNKSDLKLCGKTCETSKDNLPINAGTEFFVIQITNNSINSIFINNLQLNYVIHKWDSQTAGAALNLSSNLPTGSYPHAGTFSILKTSSTTQSATSEIKSGQTVNILVKLDSTIPDISLNKVIRVLLNVGSNQPVEFLIESGGVI